MNNHFKFFDFEVFPNWWCVVVSDEEETYPGGMYNNQFTKDDELNIKSKMRIYTSDTTTLDELKAEFNHGTLCGYNIKGYDLKILRAIMAGASPQKVYLANNIIIGAVDPESSAEAMRVSQLVSFGYKGCESFQDLMDDTTKGLKDKEASLGMDIRETTVPFGKEDLTEQDKEDIIFYCKHDVYALHVYYVTTKKSYIDTKIVLCKTFGIDSKDGYKNTNATLSSRVLGAVRTHGTTITDPTIVIHNKELDEYLRKWIPEDLYKHLCTSQESKSFKLYDNNYDIGDGGIHSVLALPKGAALYVESTDEYIMYNVDVSSCYTSVMLFCNTVSRAIKEPRKLYEIYSRRIKLKFTPKSEWSAEDKSFVAAAKLILNTTYGAMGNKYLPLYDDYMRSKTCRVGQMILLAVAGELQNALPHMKIIQNNTDGILVYTKKTDLPVIKKIIDDFTALSHFIFEIEEDNKLWQLNVNNYVAIHPNGEVKDKGGAFVTSIYQPGYNHCRPLSLYCVPAAQIKYYTTTVDDSVETVNPVRDLLNNTKVEQFILTCTKGPGYSNMVQYNNDGTKVQLGKVARVIAITDEKFGIIKKVKTIKKDTKSKKAGDIQEDSVALCPPHPLVVNDDLNNYEIKDRKLYHKITGESWTIDYSYYAGELDKALDIVWYELKNDKLEVTDKFNL